MILLYSLLLAENATEILTRRHPDSIVPCKALIHNIITKLCSMRMVLDRKKT
jgi:hypothetical protein